LPCADDEPRDFNSLPVLGDALQDAGCEAIVWVLGRE
jgi:hypothetical protein